MTLSRLQYVPMALAQHNQINTEMFRTNNSLSRLTGRQKLLHLRTRRAVHKALRTTCIKRDSFDGFSIIESPETIIDYAHMELEELQGNIKSRRNKIFLLMEEVRRLRIQQRLKAEELGLHESEDEEHDMPEYASLFPFLPPLTSKTLRLYYATCFAFCGAIIFFGGVLAPALELKLGIGFTSYADFIKGMHLPIQLSQVDPIVASFSGGAVGVISSLMVVEANNIRQQDKQRCKYCVGTGYLPCALCSGTGTMKSPASSELLKCSNCFGATKVMCPTCLCTGMALATEHDPRIDPFD